MVNSDLKGGIAISPCCKFRKPAAKGSKPATKAKTKEAETEVLEFKGAVDPSLRAMGTGHAEEEIRPEVLKFKETVDPSLRAMGTGHAEEEVLRKGRK